MRKRDREWTIYLNKRHVSKIANVVVGVEYNKTVKHGSLNPYPSGGGSYMVNYAQHNESCIQRVESQFMIYLPFIMLLQIFLLVVTEKVRVQYRFP